MGECLVVTSSFYCFGKGGHMVKDCPSVRIHGKSNSQAVLVLKLQKGTNSMHSRLGVNKKALPTL